MKKQADIILDTTSLLTRELKQEIEKIIVRDENFNNIMVLKHLNFDKNIEFTQNEKYEINNLIKEIKY